MTKPGAPDVNYVNHEKGNNSIYYCLLHSVLLSLALQSFFAISLPFRHTSCLVLLSIAFTEATRFGYSFKLCISQFQLPPSPLAIYSGVFAPLVSPLYSIRFMKNFDSQNLPYLLFYSVVLVSS